MLGLSPLSSATGQPSSFEEARRSALNGLRGQSRLVAVPRARRPEDRRRYAGDPWAYCRDVFGLELTPQQDEALEAMERETRLLIAAANNVGKTFLLGAYADYVFDAVAAIPDDE